jgi:hypothetical protein
MMNNGTTTEQAPVKLGKSIKIISAHKSLSEAVAAIGMDLSYNETLANRNIRDIEKSGGGQAFVTKDGVFYFYNCDIALLNKFEPFFGCLSNSPFEVVQVEGEEIVFSGLFMEKSNESRKAIKQAGICVHSR